jgi:hypothetical protein
VESIGDKQVNNCYVYAYCKPNGTPYYIGKGTGNRIHSSRRSELCNRHVKKYGKNVKYIEKDMPESLAFELEIFLISEFGRIDQGTGVLTNHTDGGEGALNPPKETREKLSASLKIAYKDQELRSRLSKSRKNQWVEKRDQMMANQQSPETKAKRSEASKAKWATPGYREKVMASRALVNDQRLANLRKAKSTKEHKEKLSNSVKLAWQDPDKRKKMVDAMNEPEALLRRAEASRKRSKK